MIIRPSIVLILYVFFLGLCSTGEAQKITSINRVSLSPGNNQSGKNFSYDPAIDGSGRYVVFTSLADNFPASGAVKGKFQEHAYLRDSLLNSTIQLDITSDGKTGSPGRAFSPKERSFISSIDGQLSRDGKFAVFKSAAKDVANDNYEGNGVYWVYRKNLATAEIKRLPFNTAENSRIEIPAELSVNSTGTIIAMTSLKVATDDADKCEDCRLELSVYNATLDQINLINTGLIGDKSNPSISDDGRYIVFDNNPDSIEGISYSYLYDRELMQTQVLNEGKFSLAPVISGDASTIAFTDASSFPAKVKLRNRESGIETAISNGIGGDDSKSISGFPAMSQDGRFTAYISSADNLVENDTNKHDDIFVYDRVKEKTSIVSVQGRCPGVKSSEKFVTGPPAISSDGKSITFAVLERLISAPIKDENGKVIEPADSNSFDDVYIAKIDYDALPSEFSTELRPDSPLVSVNCKGENARFLVPEILPPASAQSKMSMLETKAGAVTQTLIIQSAGSSKKNEYSKKLTAKRNELTLSNLPPGNYSVQLQGQTVQDNGTKVKTKLSLPSKFVISK
jgi:hypothetical protein